METRIDIGRTQSNTFLLRNRPRLNTAFPSPFEGAARSSSSIINDEDGKGIMKMQWRQNIVRHRKMTLVDSSRKPSNIGTSDSSQPQATDSSATLMKSKTYRFNNNLQNVGTGMLSIQRKQRTQSIY